MFWRRLLPERNLNFCVAGGFAACPALAHDVDLWVYGVEGCDLDKVRAELLTHIASLGLAHTLEADDTTGFYPGNDRHTIRKVCIVKLPMPVHILVTDAYKPSVILDGFDVSTHAVAIDWNGNVVRHKHWTPPQEPPVALLHNEKTPERMQRITERFARAPVMAVVHDIPKEDVIGENS